MRTTAVASGPPDRLPSSPVPLLLISSRSLPLPLPLTFSFYLLPSDWNENPNPPFKNPNPAFLLSTLLLLLLPLALADGGLIWIGLKRRPLDRLLLIDPLSLSNFFYFFIFLKPLLIPSQTWHAPPDPSAAMAATSPSASPLQALGVAARNPTKTLSLPFRNPLFSSSKYSISPSLSLPRIPFPPFPPKAVPFLLSGSIGSSGAPGNYLRLRIREEAGLRSVISGRGFGR